MSIPREGSRDIGDGIIVSVTPDVCKTPVGSSMVPVPYSIFAKQGDDANTAATVRFTKKRAHNMGSLITKCSGDQPGSGTGMKSGTTGAACHPKSHSSNVRIKGKWAIRHNDTWEMNNRNTLGKLTYIQSTELFEETPAILLNNRSGSELAGSEILLADASPNWGNSLNFSGPEPNTLPEIEIPGTTTEPMELPPLPPPDDNRNRRAPEIDIRPRWNLIQWELELIGELFNSLQRQQEIYEQLGEAINAPTIIGPDGLPQADMRTIEERTQDMWDQLGADSMEELEIKQEDMERANENLETLTDMPAEVGDGNVRITGDDDNGGRDCRLRPYSEGCSPPHSTPHHVVADRAFRHPGSSELYPGGIAHADGYCICVSNGTPIRRGKNMNEHGRIHILQDNGERYLGQNATPRHTATLGELENVGVAASAAVTGCDPVAMKAQLRAYHESKGLSSSSRWRADPTGRNTVSGVGVSPSSDY